MTASNSSLTEAWHGYRPPISTFPHAGPTRSTHVDQSPYPVPLHICPQRSRLCLEHQGIRTTNQDEGTTTQTQTNPFRAKEPHHYCRRNPSPPTLTRGASNGTGPNTILGMAKTDEDRHKMKTQLPEGKGEEGGRLNRAVHPGLDQRTPLQPPLLMRPSLPRSPR